MGAAKIFVSRGTPHSKRQEEFCKRLYEIIRSKGFDVVTIGEHRHGVRQALELARDEIAACHGAVVVAFSRMLVKSAIDKPTSERPEKIVDRSLPTTWNHLEAAMAYAHEIPILILIEKGVHREAMLSKRFEWEALECDVSTEVFGSDAFTQKLDHWITFVEKKRAAPRPPIDAERLTLSQLVGSLTIPQLAAVVGAAFAVAALIAAAAYQIGAHFKQGVT